MIDSLYEAGADLWTLLSIPLQPGWECPDCLTQHEEGEEQCACGYGCNKQTDEIILDN